MPRPRVANRYVRSTDTGAPPGYGALSTRKFEATFDCLPDWREALAACIADAGAHLLPATELSRTGLIDSRSHAVPFSGNCLPAAR
jgi:hypothetical protein